MATFLWYQTSRDYRWDHDGGRTYRGPAEQTHAKCLGTSVTACGLRCDTWPKFWHLAYKAGETGSCPRCDSVIGDLDTRVSWSRPLDHEADEHAEDAAAFAQEVVRCTELFAAP